MSFLSWVSSNKFRLIGSACWVKFDEFQTSFKYSTHIIYFGLDLLYVRHIILSRYDKNAYLKHKISYIQKTN